MIDTTDMPVGHRCEVWRVETSWYSLGIDLTHCPDAEYAGGGRFRIKAGFMTEDVPADQLHPTREAGIAGMLETVTRQMERMSKELSRLARTHARLLRGEVPGERKRKTKEAES
jgi:hypothetical protein